MNDHDACPGSCEDAYCGDGYLYNEGNGMEACDDGNQVPGDGCFPNCVEGKLVFTTSAMYDGNLGGVSGANAKCAAIASTENFGGTFKAWISDSSDSPSTTFVQSAVPYRLYDGTKVVDNWADLIDNSLDHAIDQDEQGNAPPTMAHAGCYEEFVWTGTNPDSTAYLDSGNRCDDWTSSMGNDVGTGGLHNIKTNSWTRVLCKIDCDETAPLYCFEQ
jgi:cysteine-rich repeat protein